MIRHDFVVEIKAPIERVFAYATNFHNFIEWQDGVSAASQSPQGPTQLGTTFTLVRTFLGQKIEAAGSVTEFVPNRKCAFKTSSGPIPLLVTQSFEPTAGGTRLTLHLEAEPGGVFRLAEAAMDRQLTSAFEAQAQKLRSVLEA